MSAISIPIGHHEVGQHAALSVFAMCMILLKPFFMQSGVTLVNSHIFEERSPKWLYGSSLFAKTNYIPKVSSYDVHGMNNKYLDD